MIVAIDLRGWGGSSHPDTDGRHPYSMKKMARDVELLIQGQGQPSLDLRPYILVGHGMGAKVAQVVASRQPQGLGGLVLIAPVPAGPFTMSENMLGRYRKAYERLREFEEAGMMGEEVSIASSIAHEDLQNLVQDCRRGSRLARKTWWTYGIASDHSAELSKANVPVLVVVGHRDQMTTVEMVDIEVCGRIAGSEMVVIEDCGHLVPIERPRELVKEMEEFCGTSLAIDVGARGKEDAGDISIECGEHGARVVEPSQVNWSNLILEYD